MEETNEALSKEQKSGVIKQSLRLKISKVFNKKNVQSRGDKPKGAEHFNTINEPDPSH